MFLAMQCNEMRRGNANAVDELMLVDGVKHDVGDDTL